MGNPTKINSNPLSIIDATSSRTPSVIIEEEVPDAELPKEEADHLLESGSEAEPHNEVDPPLVASPSVVFSTPKIKREVTPIKWHSWIIPDHAF